MLFGHTFQNFNNKKVIAYLKTISLEALRTVQVLIHSGRRNVVFDKWKFRLECRTECVNNSVIGVVDDEVGRAG